MNSLQIGLLIVLILTVYGFVTKFLVRRKMPVRVFSQRIKNDTKLFLLLAGLLCLNGKSFSQNFTSNGSGPWTTGANWVGGTAPATASQSWGTININHSLTVTGNYDFQGAALNINTSSSLTITGNFTISNGPSINVYGTLTINGNVTLNAPLNVFPGGKVIVGGDVTVVGSNYLNIGTNVAPPAYADMVIKGNLILNGGKVLAEKNARLAVFKNITSNTSGGSKLDIKSGGQVYVDGNIALTGGGDKVTNANGTTPVGFYVNGTSTATGGGSSVDPNRGTKTTMQTNDNPFYLWVQAQPNSPLPISLMSFKVNGIMNNTISVSWATASEENFDRFVVEHSTDGKSFLMIGEVNGSGNSKTLLNYSYVDSHPGIGKNYYRLKSVDLDGKFEYSGVIYATLEMAKELIVYPNPSSGESLNFKSNFTPQEDDVISIIDLSGTEITRLPITESSGQFAFNTMLRPGTYIVKYASANFQKVERLIVK